MNRVSEPQLEHQIQTIESRLHASLVPSGFRETVVAERLLNSLMQAAYPVHKELQALLVDHANE
jgi:3-oxoacyl-ACP reductase-like protein